MEKRLMINGEERVVIDLVQDHQQLSFKLDGVEFSYQIIKSDPFRLHLKTDSQNLTSDLTRVTNGTTKVVISGRDLTVEELDGRRRSKAQGGAGEMLSPMPGWVLKVLVQKGDQVKKGETLLVLEAMKMEHAIKATMDGTVEAVHAKAGDMVEGGVELIGLKPLE
jgi:biotin carboxyl carrier protein